MKNLKLRMDGDHRIAEDASNADQIGDSPEQRVDSRVPVEIAVWSGDADRQRSRGLDEDQPLDAWPLGGQRLD